MPTCEEFTGAFIIRVVARYFVSNHGARKWTRGLDFDDQTPRDSIPRLSLAASAV